MASRFLQNQNKELIRSLFCLQQKNQKPTSGLSVAVGVRGWLLVGFFFYAEKVLR
jgi:hypothetical protein